MKFSLTQRLRPKVWVAALLLLSFHAQAKPTAKPKPKTQPSTPAAPAGDGAEAEYSAPASPKSKSAKPKADKAKSLEDKSLSTKPVASIPSARVSANSATVLERNEKTAATSFKLAENGKALAPIVIAAKATSSTRLAASELARYLSQISGATFAVQTPDGVAVTLEKQESLTSTQAQALYKADAELRAKPEEALPQSGLVLGSLQDFASPELSSPDLKNALAIRDGVNGREAFAIRTQAKRVLLIGATDRATPHATSRFLEELGCRWFFPGANWEVVPSTPVLSWKLDISDRPDYLSRTIWYAFTWHDAQASIDYTNWRRRNFQSASMGVATGHSWQDIIKANIEAFRAHHEYFAEVGGKRTGHVFDKDGKPVLDKDGKQTIGLFSKVEVGNPAVRQIFVDYALQYFRQNPDADMISVDPSDGGGHSQSAEAKALGNGSVSDGVFTLANEVARAVNKEFPGKMVGLYAYNWHIAPPSFPLEPNVYVELTMAFNESQYTMEQLLEEWPKKARKMGIYDYYSTYEWDRDMLPGGKVANTKYLRTAIPQYASGNAISMSAQSSNNWGVNGRGYYLANRLFWNTSADADAILQDFYDKAFGPASSHMKRYYERLDPSSGHVFSTNLIGLAYRDLDAATKAAQDRPDVLARLDDLKIYLRYIHLSRLLIEEPDKEKGKQLRLALVRSVYGTRNSYMTHWGGFSGSQGRLGGLSNEVKDITWIPAHQRNFPAFKDWTGDRTAPQPWADAVRPTPTQIAADFQEGLAYYPAVEVLEVDYPLNDLVPVELEAPAAAVGKPALAPLIKTTQVFQQGFAQYVFYSVTGEPITFDLQVGAYAQYRGRPAAIWKLWERDAKGVEREIKTGTLPLSGETKPFTVEVPHAGAYFWEINERGSASRAMIAPNQTFGMPLLRRGVPNLVNAVFYVPKGTRQIQFYWSGIYGGGMKLVQPDGTPVPFTGNNQVNTAPVPAGMDGKLWRIGDSAWQSVFFFNLPNLVSTSAEQMLLPRALAEKDDVKLRR